MSFEGDSAFVYVLADSVKNVYDRMAVKTGLSDGINIEIKEGVDSTAIVRGAKVQ